MKWMKSRYDTKMIHSKTLRLGDFARETYLSTSYYFKGQSENQISETGAAVGMVAMASSILGLILCSTASTATRMAFFTATPVEDP
jgi:hypothetical protein